jgi:hypothetical protein
MELIFCLPIPGSFGSGAIPLGWKASWTPLRVQATLGVQVSFTGF